MDNSFHINEGNWSVPQNYQVHESHWFPLDRAEKSQQQLKMWRAEMKVVITADCMHSTDV